MRAANFTQLWWKSTLNCSAFSVKVHNFCSVILPLFSMQYSMIADRCWLMSAVADDSRRLSPSHRMTWNTRPVERRAARYLAAVNAVPCRILVVFRLQQCSTLPLATAHDESTCVCRHRPEKWSGTLHVSNNQAVLLEFCRVFVFYHNSYVTSYLCSYVAR